MAAAERIERGYLGSLLRLTLLAPEIVQAILDGWQADGLGLPRLMEQFPAEWEKQRAMLIRGTPGKTSARVAADADPTFDGRSG
jgi:hypothetical protein